ncbi:sensor histidine kinase [uncultured Amnibacterium sp.]|uniref:sensor histidine kinase n=1 Tax=uncultured Amnibacterium sp. TaxID=1631851 RepID=UPI0035CBB38F
MHASLVEWWNGVSLRTKITAVTVLLLTTGLVVSGLGTMLLLRGYLISDLDQSIDRVADRITVQTAPDDLGSQLTDYAYAQLTPNGTLTGTPNSVWQADPPVLGRISAQFIRAHQTAPVTVRDQDGAAAYRVIFKPVANGTIVVGRSLDSTNQLIARLFTIFFLFGLIVVILSAALTRLLVTSTFGPLRQVERTAAAIADGDFGQRLGNATPNTEVGRLNRSLNQMLNRIDRALADRARTIDQMRRFVGDASHELRTPLVSVRGYAELYRMGALQSDEDVARAMDRIEREAIRLGALVSDLLALARLDETRPLAQKPVELLPLAHDAALDARALAPKRMIRVVGRDASTPTSTIPVLPPAAETDSAALSTAARLFRRNTAATRAAAAAAAADAPERLDDGADPSDATAGGSGPVRSAAGRLLRSRRRDREPDSVEAELPQRAAGEPLPLVLAEEDKLRQVLTNLIGNAIRFTPEQSPIEIAVYASASRNQAVVEVIDHGEGIPPQVRDKIFQRFWRADSSRTRDTGGSGLGLAIVAAIVAAHQGTIGITTTAGGGATFRITLPLLNNDRSDEDSTGIAADPPLAAARS